MKKSIFITMISAAFLLPLTLQATTRTVVASGSWIVGTNWSEGIVPVAGDEINIPGPFTITIPNSTVVDLTSATTIINITGGTLNFGNQNSDLLLNANSVINWYSGDINAASNGSEVFITIGNYSYTGNQLHGLNPPIQLTGSGSSPLPVELVSFTAISTKKTIKLNWQTASERNNEKFIVERSVEADKWAIIGEVAGNGTTTQTNDYQFTDENPLTGNNYYRLKQMDFDGNFDYSPVRVVTLDSIETITVSPNPLGCGGVLRVSGMEEGDQLSLQTLDGQIFYNTKSSSIPIDLPAGIYFLTITKEKGDKETKKIVVQ